MKVYQISSLPSECCLIIFRSVGKIKSVFFLYILWFLWLKDDLKIQKLKMVSKALYHEQAPSLKS